MKFVFAIAALFSTLALAADTVGIYPEKHLKMVDLGGPEGGVTGEIFSLLKSIPDLKFEPHPSGDGEDYFGRRLAIHRLDSGVYPQLASGGPYFNLVFAVDEKDSAVSYENLLMSGSRLKLEGGVAQELFELLQRSQIEKASQSVIGKNVFCSQGELPWKYTCFIFLRDAAKLP